MKKLVLLIVMGATVLCGCQANNLNVIEENQLEKSASEDWNDMHKAQELRVLKDSEVIQTIRNKEDMETFVDHLDIAYWTVESVPPDRIVAGTFEFYQSLTQQLGETEPGQMLCKVLEIIVYQDIPYVGLVVGEDLAIHLTFKVPDMVHETLQSYLK